MTQRLKRWESPRREGRNDKGKGGSARQRQRRRQFQALRQKLKDQSDHQNQNRGSVTASPIFLFALPHYTPLHPVPASIPCL